MTLDNPISHLKNLVDVNIAGVAGGDLFYYDAVASLWKPRMQHKLSVYPSANQSIPPSTGVGLTFVPLYLDTKILDTQSEFDNTSNTGLAEVGTAGTTVHDDGVFAGAQVGDYVWNTIDNTYWVIASITNDDEIETTAAHDIVVGETFRWFRSKFTVTETWQYLSVFAAQIINLDDGEWFGALIYQNGVLTNNVAAYSSGADQWVQSTVLAFLDLTVGDEVEFRARHSHAASNLDVWGHKSHTFAQLAKLP